MTDEQISKSLDICGNDGNCATCPYYRHVSERSADCFENLLLDAHNFINRQKSEIERLKDQLSCFHITFDGEIAYRRELVKRARAEATTEFAKKFEEELGEDLINYYPHILTVLDNLVKEMTEQRKEDGNGI